MVETIRRYVGLNTKVMGILGVWSEDADYWETKYYKIYGSFVYLTFVQGFNLAQFIEFFFIYDNLQLVASSAYIFFLCCMAGVKSHTFLSKSVEVRRLYLHLDKEEFQPRTEEQRKKADIFGELFMKLYNTFLATGLILVALWMAGPVIDGTLGTEVPFTAWYPYDYNHNPFLYYMTYIHQSISITYISWINLNIDSYMAAMMMYTGIQCDILADNLKNIYKLTTLRLKEKSEDVNELKILSELNNTLLICHDSHKRILKFAEDVKNLLNLPIFLQFAASGISICMCLFRLSVTSPTSGVFWPILVYFLALFLELFFYCWFGNEIIERSCGIAKALFECDWVDSPQIFKENMLFFMHRTQKPIQMYAVNLFVLSMDTPKWILKTSWSAFTVLRQINNKP